ncbi:MAG: DNA recombination protein RmuC [Burkholderiaceae bacterium]|nr:DNA recombination protein RmuC [Burkholderiaceae bacterium]
MTELLTGVTLFAVLVLGVMVLLILRRSASADDPRWHALGTRMDALNKEIHALREVSNALSGVQEKRLESLSTQIQLTLDSVKKDMGDRLTHMGQTAEQSAERIRNVLNEQLASIQKDNAEKLEQMRKTVDEKLHATLEERLGQSFKLVSERLELVQRGLGEMQSLASGVGDLKRVLTNVKTRGTWGEFQLEALIEQIFTRDQYEKNMATRPGAAERVEIAIRLPGRADDQPVWLPIDAKFPIEDYQRLLDAHDQSDNTMVEEAAKALEARIRGEAKKIKDKYIEPPHTTDFAVMYLPTEGLYAEVLRRTGLAESLQRDYRVVVTGPTNTAAMLNSLQMGFRTLAIEKRSSEVWALLGGVKTEFEKFGGVIAETEKKLQEAANKFQTVGVRTRAIQRKLQDVQALPLADAVPDLLDAESGESETE